MPSINASQPVVNARYSEFSRYPNLRRYLILGNSAIAPSDVELHEQTFSRIFELHREVIELFFVNDVNYNDRQSVISQIRQVGIVSEHTLSNYRSCYGTLSERFVRLASGLPTWVNGSRGLYIERLAAWCEKVSREMARSSTPAEHSLLGVALTSVLKFFTYGRGLTDSERSYALSLVRSIPVMNMLDREQEQTSTRRPAPIPAPRSSILYEESTVRALPEDDATRQELMQNAVNTFNSTLNATNTSGPTFFVNADQYTTGLAHMTTLRVPISAQIEPPPLAEGKFITGMRIYKKPDDTYEIYVDGKRIIARGLAEIPSIIHRVIMEHTTQ